MKKCPYCDEMIEDNSLKCMYCGEKLNEAIVKQEKENIKISIKENQIGKTLTIEGKNQVKGEFKINIPKNVKVGDVFDVDGIKFEVEEILKNNKNFKGIIFIFILALFFIFLNFNNKNEKVNNNQNNNYTTKNFDKIFLIFSINLIFIYIFI